MSAQPSRLSALIFLLSIVVVIGIIAWFGWQWAQPSKSSSQAPQPTPLPEGTYNIDEQLDML